MLKLFVASRNAAIKEVHFPAELGPSYVYASPEAIDEAVDKFLGIEASGGPRGSLEDGAAKTRRRASKKRKKKQEEAEAAPRDAEAARQRRTGAGARSRRSSRRRSVARKVSGGFPVFYPTRLPSGAAYVESNPY